jgi:hypothetical protein
MKASSCAGKKKSIYPGRRRRQRQEDIPALVHTLCRGDGRQGSISGFVTLSEEDCEKIYRLML